MTKSLNPMELNFNAFDADVRDLMEGQSEIDPSEVSIVPMVGCVNLENAANVGTKVVQGGLQGASRQFHNNMKWFIDASFASSGLPGAWNKFNESIDQKGFLKTAFGGIVPRWAYVFSSMVPAAMVKDEISKENPNLSPLGKAVISAGVETTIGVQFEVLANPLIRNGNLPPNAAIKAGFAVAIPFGFRNLCGWLGAFGSGNGIVSTAVTTVAIGSASAIPDTFGNWTLQRAALSNNNSITKAVCDSLADTFKYCCENPGKFGRTVGYGAPFRIIPAALQRVFFGEGGEKVIRESVENGLLFTQEFIDSAKGFIADTLEHGKRIELGNEKPLSSVSTSSENVKRVTEERGREKS